MGAEGGIEPPSKGHEPFILTFRPPCDVYIIIIACLNFLSTLRVSLTLQYSKENPRINLGIITYEKYGVQMLFYITIYLLILSTLLGYLTLGYKKEWDSPL